MSVEYTFTGTTTKKGDSRANSPRMTPRTARKKRISVHEAAFNGDIDTLKNIVRKGRESVNLSGLLETTPLHDASYANQAECVKFLIESGADVNAKDKEGATPLQHAAFNGSYQVLSVLIEAGADLLTKDKEGSTPLHKAAFQGSHRVLALLTEALRSQPSQSSHINSTDDYGSTPLLQAAAQGHVECVRVLLEAGALPNLQERDGSSPLMKAAAGGYSEVVALLLSNGAEVGLQNNGGCTALHFAATKGEKKVVEQLLAHHSQQLVDLAGMTPLHNAAFLGHLEVARLLLSHLSANPFQEDPKDTTESTIAASHGTTPLHQAAFGGHESVVSLFLEHKAPVNSLDGEGATPLHKAAFMGHLTCVNRLLSNGALPNIADSEGSTPLHCAAYGGHHLCLKALIDRGGDVNCRDGEGGTPLHTAAFHGHIETLQVLVTGGAHTSLADKEGSTPLHHAVLRGNKTCASFLLKHGAPDVRLTQVDVVDRKGMSPLHCAVKYPPCVTRLLKEGAAVDLRDATGRTPLYYAVRNNVEESARILIFKGADMNAKDKRNKSPATASKILNKKVLRTISKEKKEYEDAQARKEFKVAVKKFNVKPQEGVEYLIDSKVFAPTPEEIAKFLHAADRLSKTKIGEYLGERDTFATSVLSSFVNRMDFVGYEFDHALRYFLSKFRLPGEAQKIDRIMETFAKKYTTDNPGVFPHEDTAYLLAFSLIMLNTDAHNPNIKKERKISKEDWIKNTRGISGGADLSDSFLDEMYHRIVKEEIKMDTEGTELYHNAEKKGYLVKQGGRIKTWKKRWFVVSDNCLYYFRTNEDTEPIGIVPLENLSVREVSLRRRFAFEIFQPSQNVEMKSAKFDAKGAVVKGHHDSYIMAAADEAEMNEWMRVIMSNIFKNPFLELVRKKLSTQKRPYSVDTLTKRKNDHMAELTKINFKTLYELAIMCAMVGKDSPKIIDKYGLNTMVGSLSKHFHFFSTINNDTKTQYIVLGSSQWTPKGLRKDFILWTQPSSSSKRQNVRTSYKLDDAAQQIFAEVNGQLKKEHVTVLAGYSLLGAVGVELAQLLETNGFQVKQLVTFGQPKIDPSTDQSPPTSFQFTRVIDIRDPVSGLFPACSSGGVEVILLADKYHTNAEGDSSALFEGQSLTENVEYHSMAHYVARIQPKLKESTLISYLEREKYR